MLHHMGEDMNLKRLPELHAFLSRFLDTNPETDEQTARAFSATASGEQRQRVIEQIRLLVADEGLSLEELGTESNRWFGEPEEACSWLEKLQNVLEENAGDATETKTVKDCNGTRLHEGDSVLVIKDLKVKGGSSDLKRGTVIRKIHLIDDADAIECRVDGSALVLKTCFLRKS